jgi:hypothetical protein
VASNIPKNLSSRAGGIMELDNDGSAESFTPTVSRLPGGKFSVRSGTSQIDTVILANQVLAGAFGPEARRPPS